MKRNATLLSLLLAAACATTQPAQTAPATSAKEAKKEEKAEAKQAQAEEWRKDQPKAGPSPELVVPKFVKSVLPNGLTVMVSEQHALPLVALGLATGAGAAADPKGKAGLATLTYDMMTEGAGPYDAVQLDEAFANLGAEPFASTHSDGAVVGTRVLTSQAEAAMALLTYVARAPRFEKAEFERQRKQRLDSLVLSLGSPGYLASLATGPTFFGENHPYAHPGNGTPESMAKLTVEDVKSFYKQQVGPKNSVFVAVGDVTLEQAVAWATKAFGDWKAPAVRPAVPPNVQPGARQLVLVPKPGLGQTVIVLGRAGVRAQSEDVAPLELASTVFGGFFGSRLNMNLREDKGYSYGANAYVDPRRGEGPIVASSSVRANVTGPSLKEFFNELEGLKTRPITSKELEAAREGLIRSLPGSFTTVEDLLTTAAGLYWEEKPLDYYARLVEELTHATPAQVQAVAEKYFDPKAMDVVMVGDPEAVKTQVTPLNLGELKVREVPKPPAAAKTAPGKGVGGSGGQH